MIGPNASYAEDCVVAVDRFRSIPEEDLCRTPEGDVMRLFVGHSAVLEAEFRFLEVSLSKLGIATHKPISDQRTYITGVEPGSVTISMLDESYRHTHECIVLVEP